jgi:hypothetical protein
MDTLARLSGDRAGERIIRYGSAVVHGNSLVLGDDPWTDLVSAPLIARIADQDAPLVTQEPPPGTPDEVIAAVASLAFQYLKSGRASLEEAEQLLTFLFKLPFVFEMDRLAITVSSLLNPELLARIPELNDPGVYGNYSEIYARSLDVRAERQADFRDLSPREIQLMRALLTEGRNQRGI